MITIISNILEWIAIAIEIKNKTDLTLPPSPHSFSSFLFLSVDDKILLEMQNLSFSWSGLPSLGGTAGGE